MSRQHIRSSRAGSSSLRILLGLGAVALILWVGYRILDPAPLSTATGIALGLLGMGLVRRHRFLGLVAGLVLGLLLGVGEHGRIHGTGGSPEPDEGVFMHLTVDALRGGSVALPALLAFWAIVTLGRRRKPAD